MLQCDYVVFTSNLILGMQYAMISKFCAYKGTVKQVLSEGFFPYPESSTTLDLETCQDNIGIGLACTKLQSVFIWLACFSDKC